MAKLVAVCRDDEFQFERRQIPLMIEESLTMVMEIPETVISTECVDEGDVKQFIKRYELLAFEELNCALMVTQKELFSLLSVSVPCVGCRRSVERLYTQLWESGQPALEPLIIKTSGVLTLSDSFLFDPKLIYALFYIHGSHLNDMVDTIPKSRRNRRCLLHSLETHKARSLGSWMDVWDLLSQECRDEVVLIDSDALLDTLENYLRKHRFCSECKSKVLKAYSILSGDIDGDAEKGYCSALYEGLKSCPKERHIHVLCDTDFIAHLIGRAEPELAGGRRERHARTIDIAQEEVLTCLGIHLWERLHRLWQKLRAEEQTWQMLFYLGVEALRKSFETAVENKQGISRLEQVVEEISEAERAKELRKEQKRLKKKKRKENKCKYQTDTDTRPSIEECEEKECIKEIECKEEADCKKENEIETDEKPNETECEKENIVEETSPKPNDSCSQPLSELVNGCQESSDESSSCLSEKGNDSEKSSPREIAENCKCGDEAKQKGGYRKNGYIRSYEEKSYHHSQGPARKMKSYVQQQNGFIAAILCRLCGQPICARGKYRDGRSDWNGIENGMEICPKCAMNSGPPKRGRKKMGMGRPKEDHHISPRQRNGPKNSRKPHFSNSSYQEPVALTGVDDEELRLLKSMGWKSPETTFCDDPSHSNDVFISEQEIRAFKARQKELQNQREELREKLRENFQKLSIEPSIFYNGRNAKVPGV